MLISQICDRDGKLVVVARQGSESYSVNGAQSVLALANEAIETGKSLTETISSHGYGAAVDLTLAAVEGRLLPPIQHPDPAHLHVTGTGLTHMGSAATRDSMHAKAQGAEVELTDSMRMFRMGIDGGRPGAGNAGVQPEWFYKGNGHIVTRPGGALVSPSFALDGGEEPEIAGLYVVGLDGMPFRVGFALSNEFSDHVTERINYLYLAHSKLRPCAFGPEILIGDLPTDVGGTSRIRRGAEIVWEKPFVSGEANMSHTLANLEHHHFKYDLFRQPGDIHVHMFGTATLSFADGFAAEPGDVFEIEAADFGLPLCNRLEIAAEPVGPVRVRVL